MMMVLFQSGPAQTTNYMIAGFIVIFGVMGLYLLSLAVRKSSLERDLEQLETIQHEK